MTLAQFGSFANVLTQILGLPPPPLCIFHIVGLTTMPYHFNLFIPFQFYNIPLLLIYLRLMLIKSPAKTASRIHAVTVVKNPFGKNIPAMLTTDKYFQDLRQLWK